MPPHHHTWNYRVIHTREAGVDTYRIHEVHYDETGKERSRSVRPIAPTGNTVDELRGDLEFMLAALVRPVLESEPEPPRG